MNLKNRRLSSFALVLTLLGAVMLSGLTAAPGHVEAASMGPTLTSAVLAFSPGAISVRGEAFIPGGEVYLALYDKWGAALHETRWISAAPDQYGMNGSTDPALGFRRGGTVAETFGGLCGSSLMVRAFDQRSAAWSNWLDVNPVATGLAVYGPNGSADPALGYRPGCQ